MKKTKAITELENRGAEFSVHEININGFVSGSKLARDGGQDPAEVFKTLVLESTDKKHFVCLIPVDEKLDFKKAAKLFKVKKLSMLPLDKLEALTGYIHGGCSPVAMKTQMPTIIDVSALQHDHIYQCRQSRHGNSDRSGASGRSDQRGHCGCLQKQRCRIKRRSV